VLASSRHNCIDDQKLVANKKEVEKMPKKSKKNVPETPTQAPPAEVTPEAAQPETIIEKPKPKPLTLASLKAEIDELRQEIQSLTTQIADIQTLRRKPTNNAKVQIKDTLTGRVFKSKNNTYQTLLKEGELKDLVEKKVLGDNPEKNNFGWFALQRAYPDRFQEVKPDREKEE
jgi:hypothetical protein